MSTPDAASGSLLDCLVIGGGPAGLTTAVYLARFKRSCLLLDAGSSRLNRIAKTRNVLGFPDGIAGSELLRRVREHAARYTVATESACVDKLVALEGGGFEASAGGSTWRARKVVLATGALDVEPQVDGLQHGLEHALVRYCPVCDGYETQGRRVAVMGRSGHGRREAAFVAGFGNEVTWLAMGTQESAPPQEIERLRERGVTIVDATPRTIRCVPGEGVEAEFPGGETLRFDMLYSALGLQHASQLATSLGAAVLDGGQLQVDDHMETTVPGLYAAGDVACGLNQINVAAGHAAIAATAIHNAL